MLSGIVLMRYDVILFVLFQKPSANESLNKYCIFQQQNLTLCCGRGPTLCMWELSSHAKQPVSLSKTLWQTRNG